MTKFDVIFILIMALAVGVPLAIGKKPFGHEERGVGIYIIVAAIVGTLAALIFGFAQK